MQSLHFLHQKIQAAAQRAGRDSAEVTLVGASKTVAPEKLVQFLGAGLHNFGENYIQEGVQKLEFFQTQNFHATWHFIGALQSNKAREAVQFELIHSLDRFSLARELDKEAGKISKVQRVLIQINLAGESSKAGIAPADLPGFLETISPLRNLSVEGLMSLPPFNPDPENMRPFHRQLRELAAILPLSAPILSMGMSGDFEVAIEEGATHIRVGTALFGARR